MGQNRLWSFWLIALLLGPVISVSDNLSDSDSDVTGSAIWPPTTRIVVGLLCVGLCLFIAAGGGIGGGSLLIPIYLIVFGLSTREAVGLSNVTIVGGALANLSINIRRKHPLKPAPLIDWDMILIMEPSTVLGALVGSYVNKLLPNWLTATLLWLLLALITVSLFKKGRQLYRKESLPGHALPRGDVEFRQHEMVPSGVWGSTFRTLKTPLPLEHMGSSLPTAGPPHFPLPSQDPPTSPEFRISSGTSASSRFAAAWNDLLQGPTSCPAVCMDMHHIVPDDSDDDNDEEDQLLPTSRRVTCSGGGQRAAEYDTGEEEDLMRRLTHSGSSGSDFWDEEQVEPQLPWGSISAMIGLFAVVLSSDLGKAQLPCGSWGYWLLALAILPVTLIMCLMGGRYVLHKQAQRVVPPCEGDVQWTPVSSLVYPLLSTFAGLVAGMFGVGGGIVKGPLLLHLGVLPDVAAATSATMILLTSATASIVHSSLGDVRWSYGSWLFCVGLLATFVGQLSMTALVDRLGRRSIIVYSMALFMLASTVAVAVQSVDIIRHAAAVHELGHFGNICA